ncbi:MAG TPA: 6-pyruvoyl tetrahydrobiopterin synthase [Deltaproteobacteria bacterium]|nr:6-pyruvoyl tetrahydrobiopterin synthase [Deltaproteobacteria bacterium]
MYRVVKELNFCYGHRLLDYDGKCAHPHGHNAWVQVEFGAENLDGRGMVIDFVDIKDAVKRFLDEELDHKMLLRRDDVLTKILQDLGEPVFVMEENPTAENIARLIFNDAKRRGLPVLSVKLWETPTSYAEYREA